MPQTEETTAAPITACNPMGCAPGIPATSTAAATTRQYVPANDASATAGGHAGAARVAPAAIASARGSSARDIRRPPSQQAASGASVSPSGTMPTWPPSTVRPPCCASSQTASDSRTACSHVPLPSESTTQANTTGARTARSEAPAA